VSEPEAGAGDRFFTVGAVPEKRAIGLSLESDADISLKALDVSVLGALVTPETENLNSFPAALGELENVSWTFNFLDEGDEHETDLRRETGEQEGDPERPISAGNVM
jgi:hypothetical protein